MNSITSCKSQVTNNDLYDYHQEVANAGFGDMLHDKERNEKYFAALRKAVSQMHAKNREVHVLDIGTGTGLLAMMAVEAGADSVTACEAFQPMADCAERIFEANNYKSYINLVKKRSTFMKIGVDISQRANLLVAELLDTELIGEGALDIYNHAHEHLLTDDVVCIPAKAICYAQIIQSPLAAQWNTLKILTNLDGDVLLRPPYEIAECKGEASLHSVQLSQLPTDEFDFITSPIPIFEFDFTSKHPRELKRSKCLQLQPSRPGSTDLVFYWWNIQMDIEGDIILSCAPFWAHPQLMEYLKANNVTSKPISNIVPWRDHWLQAIYYIPRPLHLNIDDFFFLHSHHDAYSIWFDASSDKCSDDFLKAAKRHSCSCRLHVTYARSRIGQINQSLRSKRYMRYLEMNVRNGDQVLVLGDGCLLGVASRVLGAAKVICHESYGLSRLFMQMMVKCNCLTNVEFINDLSYLTDEHLTQLTHIFAEPFFLTSILPWDNFKFGTLLMQIYHKLNNNIKIAPYGARIFAVPVEFLDLHKIRMPIVNCEGFDLQLFDEMVQESIAISQNKVEAQPLWEYPCRALSQPKQLIEVQFSKFYIDQQLDGHIDIEISNVCNGICLWVDWLIDDSGDTKSIVSTGPVEPIVVGRLIKWDMFVLQGVHLLSDNGNQHDFVNHSCINWLLNFQPMTEQIHFNFDIKKIAVN